MKKTTSARVMPRRSNSWIPFLVKFVLFGSLNFKTDWPLLHTPGNERKGRFPFSRLARFRVFNFIPSMLSWQTTFPPSSVTRPAEKQSYYFSHNFPFLSKSPKFFSKIPDSKNFPIFKLPGFSKIFPFFKKFPVFSKNFPLFKISRFFQNFPFFKKPPNFFSKFPNLPKNFPISQKTKFSKKN